MRIKIDHYITMVSKNKSLVKRKGRFSLVNLNLIAEQIFGNKADN